MKNRNTLLIALSLLVVGFIGGLLLSGQNSIFGVNLFDADEVLEESAEEQDSPEVISVSVDDDAIKGDVNAPVTIVEFSDFQCPYCARFATETYPLLQDYIDEGVVRLIYRDFPIARSHPQAELAALAAECAGEAGDDKYYEMHDKIFAGLADWSGSEFARDLFLSYASEIDVEIEACLDDGALAEEVADDYVAAQSYGVTGTPTFFINGKKVVGAQPFAVFQALIEAELN